jgi:hypothetical protein
MRPKFGFKPPMECCQIKGMERPCAFCTTQSNHQVLERSVLVKKAPEMRECGGINHSPGNSFPPLCKRCNVSLKKFLVGDIIKIEIAVEGIK